MPKLQKITTAQFKELEDITFDLTMRLQDYTNRMDGGYAEEVAEPFELARSLLALQRASADLCTHMMAKHGLALLKQRTETLIRDKIGAVK